MYRITVVKPLNVMSTLFYSYNCLVRQRHGLVKKLKICSLFSSDVTKKLC